MQHSRHNVFYSILKEETIINKIIINENDIYNVFESSIVLS